MARSYNRLTANSIKAAVEPGMYPDGDGLYLQIGRGGSKAWVFRYHRRGAKSNTDMGLGPLRLVSLAQARAKALVCRQQRLAGLDPLNEKRQAQATKSEGPITFGECARQYIVGKQPEWKGSRSVEQWTASLATYAAALKNIPVNTIDTAIVMRALDRIWLTKTETANRVRQRIESVLDWATARGYREGANPARWKGHLQNLLPRPSKIRKPTHHTAMPADEIPAFLELLRSRQGISRWAIEFVIFTSARTSEVINARWDEIDLIEKVWVIPASRMKGGRAHRVPLSPQALAVLEHMAEARPIEFVFPGQSGGPLKPSAMRMLMKYLGRDEDIHGFRASFSTWAAERTSFASEIRESCLAHTIGNETERSYRRGDLLLKRRRLMEAWGAFCTTLPQAGKIVAIGGRHG